MKLPSGVKSITQDHRVVILELEPDAVPWAYRVIFQKDEFEVIKLTPEQTFWAEIEAWDGLSHK